jgi:Radical SAM superfamily
LHDYQGFIFTDLNSTVWSRTLGAYRFSNEMKKHGIICKVIDCTTDFEDDEIVKLIYTVITTKTLFVGFSTTFLLDNESLLQPFAKLRKNNFSNLRKIVQLSRQINPAIKIIFGGANSTNYNYLNPDIIVEGYCENSMKEIVSKIFEVDRKSNVTSKVRSENLIFDLENINTTYTSEDFMFKGETLVLETSRGCRFKCKFCNFPLNGRKPNTYLKTQNNLKNELIYNYEKFNITHYFLSDDTFNESIEKIKYIKKVIDDLPFKISFFAYLRLDLISKYPEMISLLAQMGLKSAFFGIESLNDKSAKSIGKGLGETKTIETLKNIKNSWGNSIHTTASFIIGLPYENTMTLNSWLPKLLDPNFPIDYVAMFPLTISFGSFQFWDSEIAKNASTFGYKVEKTPMGEYWENNELNSDMSLEIVKKLIALLIYHSLAMALPKLK